MGPINELADQYVSASMALDPVSATYAGVGGHDDALTDLSFDGFTERAALDRNTLAALARIDPRDERERVAKEAMEERLGISVELFDAGKPLRDLNVVTSAIHDLRGVFDLMPTGGEDEARAIAERLSKVPAALSQWRRTLLTAATHGNVAARRQILEVAAHCERWSNPARDDFFPQLAQRAGQGARDSLRAGLTSAANAAAEATAVTGQFLRDELAAMGRTNQASGREEYALASRYFLGTTIDLDDAHAWGFEELARIERDMRETACRILPRSSPDSQGIVNEAVAALDADPTRIIEGAESFRTWMQALADRTIQDLNGTHFDIPDPVAHIECLIAPTSDGGIYYTGPSEDFNRPGRMWWSVPEGLTSFSTWREVTTVYHEGVPGHHLQIGSAITEGDLLNRWQRVLCWCSGHGEGWALYAERLMDGLGYLSDPGDRLGMLDGQALRAARVIVDIGMHLELTIPRDNQFGFHPGERWTPDLGWEFLRAHTRMADEMLRFELNRYLGWPGQAPSYKLGERIWLAARESARARKGAAFDLRSFHQAALSLGSLGLDPLTAALSRL